jgi:hypothetical protein
VQAGTGQEERAGQGFVGEGRPVSTVTVQVGKDKHEVETKPLTLVFKGRDLTEQISYEGYVRLEPYLR